MMNGYLIRILSVTCIISIILTLAPVIAFAEEKQAGEAIVLSNDSIDTSRTDESIATAVTDELLEEIDITDSLEGQNFTKEDKESDENNFEETESGTDILVNESDESDLSLADGMISNEISGLPTEDLEQSDLSATEEIIEDELLNGASTVSFVGGDGSEQNPYQIATAEQLNAIRNNLSANYILVSNIDLSGLSWQPIGDYNGDAFTGSLDGNGFAIRNLKIRAKDNVFAYGLIGNNNGAIKRIIIDNCDISINQKTVKGTGIIVGSIAGLSYMQVNDCHTSGKIAVNNAINAKVGGIVGIGNVGYSENRIGIKINYNSDYQEAGGVIECGGITSFASEHDGIVENCVNYGTITASSDTFLYCGGIVGQQGAIKNCVNYANVVGSVHKWNNMWSSFAANCNVGGIVGATYGNTLEDCINYGKVEAHNIDKGSSPASCFAGGIAGYIGYYGEGSIKNCYNVSSNVNADSIAGRVAGTLISSKMRHHYIL